MEILKGRLALGNLYSQIAFEQGWRYSRQEVESGSELWAPREKHVNRELL